MGRPSGHGFPRHRGGALLPLLFALSFLACPPTVPLEAATGQVVVLSGNAATFAPAVVHPFLQTNVSYLATTDGFTLSYLEQLPAGYSNSTGAPLVVFLHGAGASTTNVSGGVGGNTASGQFLTNASTFGFISLALNTRSSAGFYVNTPCGGPQATDVSDAVASEERRHKVTALYLVGFSAGSNGALQLTANGVLSGVSGIATAGTITDFYETFAFNLARGSAAHYAAFTTDMCGHGDGAGAVNLTADGVTYRMSAARFYPSNLSAVSLFLTAGGADTEAPSNFTVWSTWSNLNSTTRTVTCAVNAAFLEPSGCSQPLVNQSARTAPWLGLYELKATHTEAQLPYGAVFAFWERHRAGGFYSGAFPNPNTGVITPTVFAWEHFPTETQTLQTFGCGSATGATTGALNTPSGSAVYFFVEMRQVTAITVSTVTDTAGDTFVKAKTVTSPVNSRIELWVVNSTAGNSANRVTGTWSATDATCDWVVVVMGQRGGASWSALGAGSAGTNTTVGDVLVGKTPRNLVLMAAATGNTSNTWASASNVGVIQHANQSTTLGGSGSVDNATTKATFYPQVTVGTSGTWTALAVAIQPPNVPPPAKNLTAGPATLTTVTVRWVNPSNATGLANVTLAYGLACGTWIQELSLNGVVNSTVVSGLAPATTYCVVVFLWNVTGESAASPSVNVSTNSGPLEATGLVGVDDAVVNTFLLVAVALTLVVLALVWVGRRR